MFAKITNLKSYKCPIPAAVTDDISKTALPGDAAVTLVLPHTQHMHGNYSNK